MTAPISLRIEELRVEADLAGPGLLALEGGLEAALTELARRIQALLAGRAGLPDVLVLPDLVVRDRAAGRLLAGSGANPVADLILAQVEARLRGHRG